MASPRQLRLFSRTLEARFETWLEDNPRVWDLFEQYAFAVLRAGHNRYSADAICHRIRWHVDVETKDPTGFKLNNNHVAFLARRFGRKHPEHAGLFQTREQRAV